MAEGSKTHWVIAFAAQAIAKVCVIGWTLKSSNWFVTTAQKTLRRQSHPCTVC
jgi:hypothetical protein